MQNPIDLVLLTGFLGSGKTTLLNAILTDHRDSRTGILINEFGKVGVDGALVRHADSHSGMTVYEVADGSIFCTCKSASFVAGLRMFARLPDGRRPERLIVEASGMSDPSGLSRLLRDNRLAGDYVVTSVACLVDAVRFVKVVHTLPAVRRQVEAADLVILNKIDLVDEEALTRVESQIAEINDQATVVRSSFGRIDEDTLWVGAS
ncbi:MAG: GTP-binding protein, partial [Spirochaetota bacterium]